MNGWNFVKLCAMNARPLWAFLLLFAALACVPGKVFAQVNGCTGSSHDMYCADKPQADGAVAIRQSQTSEYTPYCGAGNSATFVTSTDYTLRQIQYTYQCTPSGQPVQSGLAHWTIPTCTAPQTYNSATGYCEDPNACVGKPDITGTFTGEWSETPTQICHSGCSYYPTAADSGSDGHGKFAVWGTFRSTGQTCTAGGDNPLAASNDPDNTCTPIGILSMCRRSDGKLCAVTPRGNKACWDGPEDIGTKSSQDQKEALSMTHQPDVTPAPPTLQQAQNSQVSDTSQSSPGGPASVVNNNFTYYNQTGVSGTGTTGAGSTGTATGSTPGTGGASSGGDTNDGSDSGTVTGTGDCDTAYMCTNDPIACAQLAEQHKAACSLAAITKHSSGEELDALPGGDNNPASATAAGLWHEHEYDTSNLDQTGFLGGSGACPVVADVDWFGTAIHFPTTQLCNWLAVGAYLVLVFAGLTSLRIIALNTGG